MARARLRRWDLVGLIGVLVLLVWAPMYMAQGEDARAVERMEGFTLPEPRLGDRMVVDLIVQWGDQEPMLFSPFATHERRVDPRGSGSFANMVTYHEAHAQVGAIEVNQSLGVYARLYDDQQDFAGGWSEGWAPNADGSRSVAYRAPPLAFASFQERHESMALERADGIVEAALKVATRVPNADPGDEKAQKAAGTVSKAVAVHNGTMVFAGDAAGIRRLTDGIVPGLFDDREEQGFCALDHVEAYLPVWRRDAASIDPVPSAPDCRYYKWYWFHPDWPEPVGFHRELRDKDDDLVYSIDLVPRSVERGDGAVMLRPMVTTVHGFSNVYGGPEPVSFEDVQNDDGPLLHNVSMVDLRQVVVDVFGGGDVVGVHWEMDDDAAHWRFKVAFQNNTTVVGSFVTAPGAGGSVTDVGWYWGPEEHVYTYRSRFDTTPPSVALAAARESLRVMAHASVAPADALVFSWGAPWYWPNMAWEREFPERRPDAPDWFARRMNMENETFILADFAWRDADGRLIRAVCGQEQRGCATWLPEESHAPIVPTATATQPLEYIEPASWGAGAAGASLVLVALVARVVAAFKAGQHLGLVAWLYAKISHDKVLDHGRRQEIVALLDNDPGLTLTEVHKRLGYGWGATVHHLQTLKREGLVAVVQLGAQRHLFPASMQPPARRLAIAMARDAAHGVVWQAVSADPGRTVHEVAAATGRNKASVHRSLRRLVGFGLVRPVRKGRSVRYVPAAVATPDPAQNL